MGQVVTVKAFLFTSPKCGPCKVMTPLIMEASRSKKDIKEFFK